MWTSVPQMPVRRISISTSLMPVSGTGTSSSQRPSSGFFLTRAFMVFIELVLCTLSLVLCRISHMTKDKWPGASLVLQIRHHQIQHRFIVPDILYRVGLIGRVVSRV